MSLDTLKNLDQEIRKQAIDIIAKEMDRWDAPLEKSGYPKNSYVYSLIEAFEKVVQNQVDPRLDWAKNPYSNFWNHILYRIEPVERTRNGVDFGLAVSQYNEQENKNLRLLFYGGVVQVVGAESGDASLDSDENEEIIINGSYNVVINRANKTFTTNIKIAEQIEKLFLENFTKNLRIS